MSYYDILIWWIFGIMGGMCIIARIVAANKFHIIKRTKKKWYQSDTHYHFGNIEKCKYYKELNNNKIDIDKVTFD